MLRKISNKELFDLSENWENSKVDQSKYYDNVMEAYEIDKDLYLELRNTGDLCQEQNNRYYIGTSMSALDYVAERN